MTVKIKVDERRWVKAKRLARQKRKELRIGVLEAEAKQPHPSREGVTVGEVAAWMEYGTTGKPPTPARSWLFDWLDENIDVIVKQLAADTFRVVLGKPPEDEATALGKRGSVYRQQIEDRIRYANAFDSNAPLTIKKKGFDLPLIDTETFIEAIRWEVK